MQITQSIRSNVLFLLAEVRAQLKALCTFMDGGDDDSRSRIVERSGFAKNLNLTIQESCAVQMARENDGIPLRAATSIATNIFRLTELVCDCIAPWEGLTNEQQSKLSSYPQRLDQVIKGMRLIEEALSGNNSSLAIKLGTLGHQLACECRKMEGFHTHLIHRNKQAQAQVSGLLIAHTIGQMGDLLLNISEALLSSTLGQPMDLTRFRALQGSLNAVGAQLETDVSIATIAEGKSGGSIAAVRYHTSDDHEKMAIFKDGAKRKLKEELQGIKRWQRFAPGIAPEIFTYTKHGDSAAMLIEHLQGVTFEHVVLQASPKLRSDAMAALKHLLLLVWSSSQKKQCCSARFSRQTQKRLADVYAVHPQFRNHPITICGVRQDSFTNLLQQADRLERQWLVPFTVLVHGDFNVDNILFDPQHNQINFIDLHRATQMDFVQDVSVFMVSNYRLQVFAPRVRRRIRKQVKEIYTTARKFAELHHDTTFELRLALGLVRSFATSTRFISDPSLAQRMFLRAHYLLEQITQDLSSDYRIPIKELFDD